MEILAHPRQARNGRIHRIVQEASRAGFGRLLDAGVAIYEYQTGLLHAKMMTVDGVWGRSGAPTWIIVPSP